MSGGAVNTGSTPFRRSMMYSLSMTLTRILLVPGTTRTITTVPLIENFLPVIIEVTVTHIYKEQGSHL
jgi:hypothetical protein